MKFKNLYIGLQGFALGSIVMAYVANYNRSQLPIALMCFCMSILFRPDFD